MLSIKPLIPTVTNLLDPRWAAFCVCWVALCFLGLPVAGALPPGTAAGYQPGANVANRPPPGVERIGVDEHVGERFPTDLSFRDEHGRVVRLSDVLAKGRPVLLTFNYYHCPVLCALQLERLAKALDAVPWKAGERYEALTIGIAPNEGPEDALARWRRVVGKRANLRAGWRFLTGDAATVRRAVQAAGIRYFRSADGEYAHPAVALFLTPDGRIARYLYGLEPNPRDVRLALIEAADGKTTSAVEQLILYCYHYDPKEASYALVGYRVMQIGGGLLAVAVAAVLFWMWRRDVSRRRGAGAPLRQVESS